MKKPLRILKNQLVNAILMVALTVPLILVAVSLAEKPTLSFEGARIQVANDGSVQLLFDVCIRYTEMTDGAQFALSYNSDYIVPSRYDTNEEILVMQPSDPAFRVAPGLYRETIGGVETDVYPFAVPTSSLAHMVRPGEQVSMYLFADPSIDVEAHKGVGMKTVLVGERKEPVNVFDASEKVVLGTMSFRVKDPDLMPEITERFDGLVDVLFEKNHAKDVSDAGATAQDKLIYFGSKGATQGSNPWGIGVCTEQASGDYYHEIINDYEPMGRAQAAFTYDFPKTIIKARAAEASLTLNAYQAYTDGTVSDIDAALQRYSPAITVTYSDGSEGNFIMPWSRTGTGVDDLPWTATVATNRNVEPNKASVDVVTDSATQVLYDPTASVYKTAGKPDQNYLVEKRFCYEEYGEKRTFPVPIAVDLTVTPITLLDVTANDLHKSYILGNALVDGLEAVQTLGALQLPSQARLITDVPAGGNTLTMDIPGWSHPQTYSTGTATAIRYWPSDDTATPGTGTGTEMIDLWKDGADETTGAYLHWPVYDDKDRWNEDENGTKLGSNRAGNYTFQMAESYGGEPTYFTRSQIQAEYPWLTVPDSTKLEDHPEAWPIDDAIRTIIWNEDPDKPATDPKLEDANNYRVEYISTTVDGDGQPVLTLRVTKVNGTEVISLPDQSMFRILLPDGTEQGIGPVGIGSVDGVTLPDWFADNAGSYDKTPVTDLGTYSDRWGFDLTTDPGDPTAGSYGTERENLRRHINLGGWFYVSVKEKGDIILDQGTADEKRTPAPETLWSDFIPVYVPPRDNYYTESKVYNFIGDNAGLYPWPGGVSATVILPPGTYSPVTISGNAIVPEYDPVGSTTRKVERYGVSTTYDGATGAQPGELNTFTVDPGWAVSGPDTTTVPGHSITTYGENVFLDSAVYNAYGKVLNLADRTFDPVSYQADAYTGTIRVEETTPAETREGIVLEYVSTNGGESSYNTDGTNVTNVIFETRTEGYTMRQDYVLRLRNIGDVDISGISIDTLTDLTGNGLYDKSLDSAPAGGHFVILKPPASFLPAGESTEFVVSYVYDLRAASSTPVDYRDKLFITSNSHNKVPTGSTTAGADYLLDFDAQFQVTSSEIHRVFVQVVPSEGTDLDGNTVSMPLGTANVIIGLEDPNDLNSLNTNAGPTAYSKEIPVYILISPKDEYTMVTVTAHTSAGGNVDIDPLPGLTDGKLPDGRLVYFFEMPDFDTTVTVTFEEPPRSKLRLSDLRVYADADQYHADGDPSHTKDTDPGCLYPYNEDWNKKGSVKYKSHYQQRIWQKGFTDAEKTAAATYTTDDGEQLYLMTKGRTKAPDFDSQVDQYLVVLPFDADWTQVEVDLRAVQYIFDKANDPIQNLPLENVVVQMTLYDTDNVNDMLTRANAHDIYPQTYTYNDGTTNVTMNPYAIPGKTNGPTTHTSRPFLSPEPGSSKYVRIQLSYTEDTVTAERAYYIELHRATEGVVAQLNYGNSPYGMIMNDPAITSKTEAKTAFVENNYTFYGVTDELIPSVVKANDMTGLHYWLETWTSPTEIWTAPNANWTASNAVYDADTGMSADLYYRLSGWRNDPDSGEDVVDTSSNIHNLDLNDYAFFAIMGEAFRDPGIAKALDSSGREVDLSKAVLSVEVKTLDSSKDKDVPDDQISRFTLPTDPDELATRTITFGFLDQTDSTVAVSGDTVKEDWATWYLTPDPDRELTQDPTGNTLVEIRPGRYQLNYTFPDYNYIPADPVNGTAEQGDHLTITREFVVLAPVGDVNADLVTTGSNVDEKLMEGRISPDAGYPALGYMAYQGDAIFKLRTCDVNNDRNINNIDANTIKENTTVKRFYLPVGYIPAVAP